MLFDEIVPIHKPKDEIICGKAETPASPSPVGLPLPPTRSQYAALFLGIVCTGVVAYEKRRRSTDHRL